ncbi:MAG: hypothetical protein ACREV1_08275 [Gammaproteobacteria bacterium]
MKSTNVIGIPDGDEIFSDGVRAVSSTDHDEEANQPWVELAVEVKPTGGKDARNKKKE